MSPQILHFVTLLAVSLHVVLGCCWHHAHHCVSTAEADVRDAICPFHGHQHGVGEPHDGHGDVPHRHDPHQHDDTCCDGVACTFYSPDRSDSDFECTSIASPLMIGVQVDHDPTSANLISHWAIARCAKGIPVTKPGSAQLQLWLI